jgi:hypothetical protein
VDGATEQVVFTGTLQQSRAKGWGTFAHYYEADFSAFAVPGRYNLRVGDHRTSTFAIGRDAYGKAHEDLLGFMRQLRCGYNPFLDRVCHQRDGRSFYGPIPDSTFVDVSGGWHDAGDQLKYLITGSNATARMLLAYELAGNRFGDATNQLGQPGPNGMPDVLDEAKWGLNWLHKMHPGPDQLIHQVADDRDHVGWKMPDEDNSDYGWGPNSYRPAYYATGTSGAGGIQERSNGDCERGGTVRGGDGDGPSRLDCQGRRLGLRPEQSSGRARGLRHGQAQGRISAGELLRRTIQIQRADLG